MCPTGKSHLPSYQVATEALGRSLRKHGKPMQVYRCPECEGWHIGRPSRTGKKIKTINRRSP